jgi:maltooligosyltrehalose trehalohydrolase
MKREESDRAPGVRRVGGERWEFRVWAPFSEKVELEIAGPPARRVPLEPEERGYHAVVVDGVSAGERYLYRLTDGRALPDPVSRSQPDGVHAPSAVVDLAFEWTDSSWRGLDLADYVISEIHVGTFTPEGTLDAAVARLDDLVDLGITAVELMPVAQFPGERNWGYDGVYHYAVQNSYGGAAALARFVDACHARRLAVVLDVVYNHFGPEGNYVAAYGPYFTGHYHTPWGDAINFDGAGSDEVRRFFIGNALQWVDDFHVDALRLDAVHAIVDMSAYRFLEELADAVHARGRALDRRIHLIAESDLNDPRIVRPRAIGGYELDAQWSDDFHHALHALLTSERHGYYEAFGEAEHLARAVAATFVYGGDYSSYRGSRYGAPAGDVERSRFVVFAQNHDQIGNRMKGERLSTLITFEKQKLAATAVILSPFLPLLFMGEEYGETAPFLYFTSHSDERLVEAVREGRKAEFAAFRWSGEPPPADELRTFEHSKLQHHLRDAPQHRALLEMHRELLRLRRLTAGVRSGTVEAVAGDEACTVVVRYSAAAGEMVVAMNFSGDDATVASPAQARLELLFDSASERWNGSGAPAPGTIEAGASFRLAPGSALVYATPSVAAGGEGR